MSDAAEEIDPLSPADLGAYWADHAERFEQLLARPSARFMQALDIAPQAVVLDVGCGIGGTTRAAARRASAGRVVGVDLSAAMIARAREQAAAEGLANIAFIQGDAAVQDYAPASFDLVFSQLGMSFFAEPEKAFCHIAAAMKPDAPLVFLCWQSLIYNEYRMIERRAFGTVVDLDPPSRTGSFSLAEPPRTLRLLEHCGFHDVTFEDVHEPLYLGDDAESALRFICEAPETRAQLDRLSPEQAERVVTEFGKSLRFRETPDGISLGSAAWLVRARRKGDVRETAR